MTAMRILAVWLAFALAAAAPAEAQDQDQLRAARRLVELATRDYNRGRYAEALERYQEAYDTYPAPGLLFNLGQCHRELRHHARAVELFEQYLRERPQAANRPLAEELIAESRAAIASGGEAPAASRRAAAEARESAAEAELARARLELESARTAGAEELAAERAQYQAALEELEAAENELQRERLRASSVRTPEVWEEWWFWTTIGGVVVLAAIGITLGVVLTATPTLPFGSLGTIDAR